MVLEIDGISRTYWLAPDASTADAYPGDGVDREPPPLLLALHGFNSSGSRLAQWSGLHLRAASAGFYCVFPDALNTIWDDHGCGRHDGADDAAFIVGLIEHLAELGAADPNRVVVTGISSGATFAERLVRTRAISVNGIALVAGTARVASTTQRPLAASACDLLLIAGTGDPISPYEGGAARGPVGRIPIRAVRRSLLDFSGHESVAAEALCGEWVAANGCATVPSVEALAPTAENFAVNRLQWARRSAADPAVTLYRIERGGHGWPSGRQYLPARMLGRIPQGFDATGIVLDFARAAIGRGRWADADAGAKTSNATF